MKLDAADRTILNALGTEARSPEELAEELAAELDVGRADLDARLADLADNGLVTDPGDGRVQRTDSGRRVVATSAGERDNRIDTSPEIEAVLGMFGLGPDGAEAVRGAFAFLRYWGEATVDELVDAIYSEDPADYGTGDAWWSDLVRDPLAALPGVVAPVDPDEPWRYAGPAEVNTPGADGTRRLARPGHQPYGSVKHAIESLELEPSEREAVRAAFGFLRREGEASEADIAAAAYHDHPADYPTPDTWWDECVRDAFAELPGVSRADGDVWRYRQRTSSGQSGSADDRERSR
ncbi:hypothetical protein HUG10_18870 (plasmid) [Halorarum halophilum]|uniref:Uncharacterized protein n=1 Tax=Halorarum halophilum TaxID=2743090 RepID=A0A7D5GEC2_9EURY|nr:hypothetical protein [Halobaculum halophilum]QLG29672.1 hypothetical protein HUG10_18870 [Halobaculum halophilum]